MLMLIMLLTIANVTTIWAQGPGTWTEYSNNPVFGQGVNNGPKAYYPNVLIDDNNFSGHGDSARYKMWYGTADAQTGLAISSDGKTWTDLGTLTMPTSGYHATVEYYSNGFAGMNTGLSPDRNTMYYRMWYWKATMTYDVSDLRYAESADGKVWHNDQPLQNSSGKVPIVQDTNPRRWNSGSYGPCNNIFYDPNTSPHFTMYYDGTTGGEESIGLAYSDDGVSWWGYDADNDGYADPVLTGSSSSTDWDYHFASRCSVLKEGPTDYKMWYSGGNTAVHDGIGYATSSDGISWSKYPSGTTNKVFHKNDTKYPGYPWRSSRTYCPSVIKDGDVYKMWYAGKSSTTSDYAIGYAGITPNAITQLDISVAPETNFPRSLILLLGISLFVSGFFWRMLKKQSQAKTR